MKIRVNCLIFIPQNTRMKIERKILQELKRDKKKEKNYKETYVELKEHFISVIIIYYNQILILCLDCMPFDYYF